MMSPIMSRFTIPLYLVLAFAACGTRHAHDSLAPEHENSVEHTRVSDHDRGCWDERPCDSSAVCHWGPLPCGPAGCEEVRRARPCGSTGVVECSERESCVMEPAPPHEPDKSPYGQCRATKCETDGDCRSANLRCAHGVCEHRGCKRSSECDGYCVQGVCAATAGECLDPEQLQVQ